MLTISRNDSLEIAEDLCHKRRPVESIPYLNKALSADPYNMDAYIQMAFIAPNFDASVEVLRNAELKGSSLSVNGLLLLTTLQDVRSS